MEKKTLKYETKIQFAPSSMRQLNEQFSLVDILLCYHGKNRNGSSMSKEVIEAALPSLYGVPIVGEYIYLDDGSKDFGSHGGQIIVTQTDIRFEDTTVPYGFITRDAVENAKWVKVLEKDGHTEHEYLELKGCIIWTGRYEEVSSILDKNYGQSMEIVINDYDYDDNWNIIIKDFTFSAACILGSWPDGTDVEPCFESAYIGRHYELDGFRKELSYMMDEYNKYLKQSKKGANGEMNLEKLDAYVSSFKIGDSDVSKYCRIGAATETDFTYIDKEDNFKCYSVGYATDDDGNIQADFENKVEKSFSVVDADSDGSIKISEVIDFNDSINKIADERANKITEELSATFKAEIDGKNEEYKQLQGKMDVLSKKLAEYEAIEEEKKRDAHKAEIDEVVNSFASKLGRNPQFLVYRAKLNPDEVTVEQVRTELTLMVGKAAINNNKGASFSYYEPQTAAAPKEQSEGRYGHLLDKYM